MKLKLALACLAVSLASLGGVAASAQARSIWTNTPRNVADILVHRWNTPDGEAIDYATCRGVWSASHQHTQRGWEFHRMRCTQWDDVNRHFLVSVIVAGPRFQLKATVMSCDDSESRYRCP